MARWALVIGVAMACGIAVGRALTHGPEPAAPTTATAAQATEPERSWGARPPATVDSAVSARGTGPVASTGDQVSAGPSGNIASTQDSSVTLVGPWGRLGLTSINLEPPYESAKAGDCPQDVPEWYFRGQRIDTLPGYLASMGLDEASRAWLLSHVDCYDEGCVAVPNFDLIKQLTPDVRGRLYRELRREPNNRYLMRGFRCPASDFESRIANASLDPATEARLRHLIYVEDGLVRMYDAPLLCARALSDDDRVRIVRTLARTPAVVAHLEIHPSDDLATMAQYWNARGRRRDVFPILEAARQRATATTPTKVDVIHLLPPTPRARLDTFVGPNEPRFECTWSTRNFFADPPDEMRPVDVVEAVSSMLVHSSRVSVPEDALQWRAAGDVGQVGAGLDLGDALVFVNDAGVPHHVASFVAGDLAFTKNGVGDWNPFVLMRVRDIVAVYPETASIRVYRFNMDSVQNGYHVP